MLSNDIDHSVEAVLAADEVRSLLASLGMSQRQAAEALDISERTMRYYCAGRYDVPVTILYALKWLNYQSAPKGTRTSRQSLDAIARVDSELFRMP